MILRPLLSEDRAATSPEIEPVWQIVSRTQAVEADQYLLVGQPDHARLSGEIASKFRAHSCLRSTKGPPAP
jgi:hypothetical protein